MKRKNFKIEFENNGVKEVVIKHTWNAANKEIVSIIRQIARNQGQYYENIQEEQTRGSDGFHEKGTRTWQGLKTGKKVFFTIERII